MTSRRNGRVAGVLLGGGGEVPDGVDTLTITELPAALSEHLDVVALVFDPALPARELASAITQLRGRDAVVLAPAGNRSVRDVAQSLWGSLWHSLPHPMPAAIVARGYVIADVVAEHVDVADGPAVYRAVTASAYTSTVRRVPGLRALPLSKDQAITAATTGIVVRARQCHEFGRDTIHGAARWYAKRTGKGDISRCPMHRARQAAEDHRRTQN